MFVLLADVVFFGEVDQVDDRLGGQQHERVDDLDLGQRCQWEFVKHNETVFLA